MSDPVLDQLALLPTASPSAARIGRVRARCHRVLGAQQPAVRPRTARRFWRPALAAIGGVYLLEAIRLMVNASR